MTPEAAYIETLLLVDLPREVVLQAIKGLSDPEIGLRVYARHSRRVGDRLELVRSFLERSHSPAELQHFLDLARISPESLSIELHLREDWGDQPWRSAMLALARLCPGWRGIRIRPVDSNFVELYALPGAYPANLVTTGGFRLWGEQLGEWKLDEVAGEAVELHASHGLLRIGRLETSSLGWREAIDVEVEDARIPTQFGPLSLKRPPEAQEEEAELPPEKTEAGSVVSKLSSRRGRLFVPSGGQFEYGLALKDLPGLRALAPSLEIQGDLLVADCRELHRVAEHIQVRGDACFERLPRLARMRGPLVVSGDLLIRDCPSLEALPDDLLVGGNLILQDCPSLKAYPRGLRVTEGYLAVGDCPRLPAALPACSRVRGWWAGSIG